MLLMLALLIEMGLRLAANDGSSQALANNIALGNDLGDHSEQQPT